MPRTSCYPPSSTCAQTYLKEEEDYLASKRYISEKFFNMRISHPDAPGLQGAGLMWQGAADKAAGVGQGDFGKDARVLRDILVSDNRRGVTIDILPS